MYVDNQTLAERIYMESKLADRLSMVKTTKEMERRLLESFKKRELPKVFKNWRRNPVEDWGVVIRIVTEN